MKRWYVVTPTYGTVVRILDDGTGPEEFGADVVEVEAPTKREAITIGVKKMLAGSRREFRWCREQRGDGCNPFAGVKAVPVEDDAELLPS